MSRKSKKKARSPRKKRSSSLVGDIKRISIKVLSITGLSVLALLILLFVLSTVFAWLFNEENENLVIPSDISLEVLNGCGMDGAAKELTSILRKKGYRVADFRNADNFDYQFTTIKVRNALPEEGDAVAVLLGCDRIVYEPSKKAVADISIIIGPDWEKLKVVTGEENKTGRIQPLLDFFRSFHYFK